MKLANSRAAVGAVRDAIDDQTAHAADALAAVRIEGDGVFSLLDQSFVDDVEHFEERHVGRHLIGRVVDQSTRRGWARLTPDSQLELH